MNLKNLPDLLLMRLGLLFVLLFALLACTLAAESDREKQLFKYMNSERVREGVNPLIWDDALHKVALEHSKDMARMHKVSHTGSDGSQPHERIREARIFAAKTAENIAGDLNIISAHTELMKSLYHRENILDPDFTHGADAVYEVKGYLYITELFIEKLSDYGVDEARKLILRHINIVRLKNELPPLVLSETLTNVAQSHVEVQIKMSHLSPLLIAGILRRQTKGSIRVNVYTSDSLRLAPDEVTKDYLSDSKVIGIGFKRTQGRLCENGCYVIALIFGSSEPPAES